MRDEHGRTRHGGSIDEHGLTLLEVMISALVVVVIVGGAYAVLFTGADTYGTGVTIVGLQEHANRVVDEIAERLAVSGQATLSPVPGALSPSAAVTFQECRGFTSGAVLWAPPARISLRYSPTDPNDGKDNNGNGLVDECECVCTFNLGQPDERTVVLTRWVREYLEGEVPNSADDNGNLMTDERGLAITRNGDAWTIRLTLERPDAKGRILVRSVETSVTPRN
jgi:hypothetical protein